MQGNFLKGRDFLDTFTLKIYIPGVLTTRRESTCRGRDFYKTWHSTTVFHAQMSKMFNMLYQDLEFYSRDEYRYRFLSQDCILVVNGRTRGFCSKKIFDIFLNIILYSYASGFKENIRILCPIFSTKFNILDIFPGSKYIKLESVWNIGYIFF